MKYFRTPTFLFPLFAALLCCGGCNEFGVAALAAPPSSVDVTRQAKGHPVFPPGAIYEARETLFMSSDGRIDPNTHDRDQNVSGEGVLEPGTRLRIERVLRLGGFRGSGMELHGRVLDGPNAGRVAKFSTSELARALPDGRVLGGLRRVDEPPSTANGGTAVAPPG